MANRRACGLFSNETCSVEKAYPASRLGRTLMIIGVCLVVLFACWWFWLAVIGAVLIVVGYLVMNGN